VEIVDLDDTELVERENEVEEVETVFEESGVFVSYQFLLKWQDAWVVGATRPERTQLVTAAGASVATWAQIRYWGR